MNTIATERDLRAEIRQQIHLGHYDIHEIADALFTAHGEEWVYEETSKLITPYAELTNIIRKQLGQERRKADRESPSQKRMRLERERDEAIELGLVRHGSSPEEVSKISAFTWLTARMDKEVKALKREAIQDFLTDLLVPQAIPGKGWKRRADLTHDDCLAVADDYRKRATTETGMAFAFAAFADAIISQGVTTLGQIDAELILEKEAA